MTMLASQITSLPVVCSIVYSDVNQRKHQSSASLAFVREIHRGPVNFPHKWPVTRKMFPFDDVIMTKPFAVRSWIKNFISQFYVDIITSSCLNLNTFYSLISVIKKKAVAINFFRKLTTNFTLPGVDKGQGMIMTLFVRNNDNIFVKNWTIFLIICWYVSCTGFNIH